MYEKGSSRGRLRVLQVVDGTRMGGAEKKLWELISKLNQDKFEVSLANVGPIGPLEQSFRQLEIEIFHFPRRFAFDLLPVWRLYRLMKQRGIDIVQTTLLWADVVGALAAAWARVPVILSWETVSHEGDPFHNNFQRRAGYRLAMRWVDKIIPVSEEIKRSLIRRRRIPEDKIRVVHYGVDLEKFHPNGHDLSGRVRQEVGAAQDTILIGLFGRLEPPKGHRYFIEALPEVVKRHPQVRVVFVGDGVLRQELEELAQQLQVKDHIRFLGFRNDVNELLNAVDLFVLPSVSEGLPNAVLEAMACEKPVIASEVGGIPEAVKHGENGYLVPPGDAKALRDRLLQCLVERSQWRTLARRARQNVERQFSLQQQLADFESIYEQTFAAKTGHAQTRSHTTRNAQ